MTAGDASQPASNVHLRPLFEPLEIAIHVKSRNTAFQGLNLHVIFRSWRPIRNLSLIPRRFGRCFYLRVKRSAVNFMGHFEWDISNHLLCNTHGMSYDMTQKAEHMCDIIKRNLKCCVRRQFNYLYTKQQPLCNVKNWLIV
jgi:hypothetical protein